MIMYAITCDHPDCPEEAPEASTEMAARALAISSGWQRWNTPGDSLDFCAEHRRMARGRIKIIRGGRETAGQT